MWPLASVFVDIALHRRGPQDLPASQFLVGLLLAVYFVVGLSAVSISGSSGTVVLFLVVDGLIYYFAFVWLVLRTYERQRRYLQTVGALLGVDILLTLLSLPLRVWSGPIGDAGDTNPPMLPVLLYFAVYLWSLDIAGFVLSRALERPYISGVLIVLLYAMISMLALESLATP